MKKRYYELDFIRAIATISIVLFHFYVNQRQPYNTKLFFPNIDLGHFGVSLFLILSGCALVISEKPDEKFKILNFYKKRIKSLFPIFYLGTIIFFTINFINYPHLYDSINPIKWILTIVGFDGFFSYKFISFYQVGKWCLGCIIILYIVYPLLRFFINKYPKITFIVLLISNILIINNYNSLFTIPIHQNPCVRLMEFALGMYFAKFIIKKDRLKSNKINILTMIGSLILFILFAYIPYNLDITFKVIICGGCSFVFLFTLARYLNVTIIKSPICLIATYSYAIFIVHHQVGGTLANKFNNTILTNRGYYYSFIVYLILTFVIAYSLKKLSDKIFNKNKKM